MTPRTPRASRTPRARLRFETEWAPTAACVTIWDDARWGARVAKGCIAQPYLDSKVMEVASIAVNPTQQRQRIGTQLYEHLARLACARYGRPLASADSYNRSPMAEGFWRKQAAKGRAICTAGPPSCAKLGACWRYVLPCPAPATLGRSAAR